MNKQWRDGCFLTILAATIAVPACAQVQERVSRPADSNAQRIPDFSGIWAHLTWPDFEPPPSGPGPVKNTSRRNGRSDTYQLVGDYTNPILRRHAAEAVKKQGQIAQGGLPAPTPSNQCWPGGVPYVLWNIGMQMIQQTDRITILYSNDHEIRHVRLNQPHPDHVTPSWYGDSVGHYEGDTLVIDTIGVKVGPYAMVDMYGTPHTEALHVVERYRLLDYEAAKEAEERGQKELFLIRTADPGFARNPGYRGTGLQLEFTVEDDGVFTKPWSAAISYRRPLGGWPEMSCAENTASGYIPGFDSAVPTADKPDF